MKLTYKIALGLIVTSSAHAAALLGISEPSWGRSGSTSGFAGWEWWDVPGNTAGAGQFTNLAPDQTGGGAPLNPLLSQSNASIGSSSGALTSTGLPGRLTSGGLGVQYQFTLTTLAVAPVSSILIQIKHSNFLDADFNEVASPFTVALNGGTAITGTKNANGTTTPENYRWSSSDGTTATGGTGVFFWTYSYLFTDLDIAAGDDISLDLTSLADTSGFGFSVDTVTMDVQYATTVPEPAAIALLGLGIGAGALRRRRTGAN